VIFAKEAFLNQVTLINIKEFIVEKDLFSVRFAIRDLLTQVIFKDIKKFTIAKHLKNNSYI
jgi:hypothetical protein